MATKKTLVAAMVLALVSGPLVAFSLTAQGSADDPTSVVVPNASIGDSAYYATFVREGTEDTWEQRANWSFMVEGTRTSTDQFGRLHDVISIVQSPEQYQVLARAVDGLPINRFDTSWKTDYAVQLSLTDRSVVSLDVSLDGAETEWRVLREPFEGTYTGYGPIHGYLTPEGYRNGGPPSGKMDLHHLAHAGRSYHVGDDLPGQAESLLFSLNMGWELIDGGPSITTAQDRSWVAQRGRVQSYDAMDLRTEGCLTATLIPGTPEAEDEYYTDGMEFLHTDVPVGATVCYAIDVWVSPDVPYPVYYREQTTINGTPNREYVQTLTAFRAGSQPIPWKDADAQVPGYAFELTEGNQRHPADGTGSRLPFKLSEAMASASNDATLVGFKTWRTTHPEAMLIGARLHPMYTREPDYLAWQLVYGVPTEGPTTGVYVVSSHRHARDPIWNRDVGEFQTESFRLEQFPTGQMTLGQAERLWYEYSRNATDPESPVNVWWGYLYFPPYVKCFSTTDCQDFTGKGRGRILPDAGDWLMLGNRKTYDTLDTRYWQNTVEPFGPQSYVFMMTSPPSFYTNVHWERHAEFTPTDVAGSAAPPPPPGGAAPTPTSADLELAAIVSISAVAVVLATYFLPLLRFLGASVVVAVPGYAKIKRSEVLEKKTRDELVTLVRANPGITTSELVQGVGTGWNTAVYHLRVLEKNGFVSSLVDGRHKRFFPQESINWSDRERTAVLRNERTRQLYETILEEPGVIQGQLAKRAGISLPAVYWHVRRLEGAGLVGHDKLGRRVHYYPSQAAQRAAAAPAAMEVA